MLACKDNECKPQWKYVLYAFIFPPITHITYPSSSLPCGALVLLVHLVFSPCRTTDEWAAGSWGQGEWLRCLKPHDPLWVAMSVGFVQTPFCIAICVFLLEMTSLFFSPMTLLRSVISLVGGTGLADAGGCCRHAGQGVSPLSFSGSWSSSAQWYQLK